MIILRIFKWFLLIVAFKWAVAFTVAHYYTDPRRDIEARKALCRAYNPNVVFIGTSRTLYGIDPTLFDSLNGHATRSYNFGIFSLSPYSSLRLAEELLAESPAIKTIYIELSALDYSTVALPSQQVVQDAVFRARVLADYPETGFQEKANSFLIGLNTTLFQMVSIAPQILAAKKAIKPENDPVEGNADLRNNGHQSVALTLKTLDDRGIANKRFTTQMRGIRPSSAGSNFYLSQLNQLITHAGAAGKKVVFYYPNSISRAEYPDVCRAFAL